MLGRYVCGFLICVHCVHRRVVMVDVLFITVLHKRKKKCTCYASHVVITMVVITERSNVDVKFQKQFCMAIGFPIDDENTKEKNHKGSDVFRVMDSYFQLAFRTR
jgi:hypothetical protein